MKTKKIKNEKDRENESTEINFLDNELSSNTETTELIKRWLTLDPFLYKPKVDFPTKRKSA